MYANHMQILFLNPQLNIAHYNLVQRKHNNFKSDKIKLVENLLRNGEYSLLKLFLAGILLYQWPDNTVLK